MSVAGAWSSRIAAAASRISSSSIGGGAGEVRNASALTAALCMTCPESGPGAAAAAGAVGAT